MKLRPVSKIILAVLYVLISFIILFPLLWMVATSLKAETEVFTSPPRFFGESLMFSNYVDAFKKMNFFLGMRNSLIITGGTMIGSILTSIFVAYGFARFKFPMKSTLFTILISMMALPFAALMVPQYLMFNNLKWINTFYPLIVPTLFGAPYYIFMARQYILSIPTALDEAARIDGCNYLSVLWRIIFPVCMPIVITIGLFQFRTAWNDFLGPNIYMRDQYHYPLTIVLANFSAAMKKASWALKMAAATMVAVPPIIVFLFFQKQFIEGITQGAIKG